MADFNQAYERMIADEGGYQLTNVKDDRGGQTFAGISRAMNPDWSGWKYIDDGLVPPAYRVREFYRTSFWLPIKGDAIFNQDIASSIFNFHVNAGVPARKLAQVVVGVTPDGVFGDKTLTALNSIDAEVFKARYALAKIARYRDIVAKDRTQIKFLLGWINRTLKELA